MAIIDSTALKTHLGISDSDDDATLTTAAAAACSAIINYCGRDFTVADGTATARVFYPKNTVTVLCDDFADNTDLAVATDVGDSGTFSQAWTSSDYQLEPLNNRDGGLTVPYYRIVAVNTLTFPSCNRRASVQVTANWGWAELPDPVLQATLIKAARIFKRKDSPEGVLGGFADLGAVRVSNREDPDVAMLLGPYRRSDRVMLV